MMLKNILNKKNSLKKDNILQSIIGIGDILVYEVDRNNDARIISTLKKLYILLENFFSIRKIDEDKFYQLILSKEYLDFLNRDEKNAQFSLFFNTEEHLDGFETLVGQVIRVYKKSSNVGNIKVTKFAIYTINKILKFLSREIDNDLFIKQMLHKSNDIILESITENKVLFFSGVTAVYKDVIFDHSNQFQICYLASFDDFLFNSAKYIISQDRLDFFKEFVINIIEGIHLDLGDGEIWDYGHLILDQDFELYTSLNGENHIEEKIKDLADSLEEIYSINTLKDWLVAFAEIKKIIEANLHKSQTNKALELESTILKIAHNKFKLNNLKKIFIYIGGFCLFEKRYNFINYLWNYKQPKDADAIWISHELIPENFDSLMRIYFDLMENKLNFFVDHHGSDKYIKNYFILLLARILQNIRPTNLNENPETLYHLPDLNIHKVSDLIHRSDELVKYVKAMIAENHLLSEFDFENINILERVISFVEHVKEEAKKQISAKNRNQPISKDKIEAFKNIFVVNFYKCAAIRDIITKYFKAYNSNDEPSTSNDKQYLGIYVVDNKAVFFESWYIPYTNWERGFAQSLSAGEDSRLFKDIMAQCESFEGNKIESCLSLFDSLKDVVILSSGINILKYFSNDKQFQAAWRLGIKKLDILGFQGWFNHNNLHQIPVFGINNTGHDDTILILDKNKFGKLCQYSPLKENTVLSPVRDIFYMNIELLSEREDLVDLYMKNPPDWLSKIGDQSMQKEYIKEKVLIEINERFEFKPSDNFFGYRMVSNFNSIP